MVDIKRVPAIQTLNELIVTLQKLRGGIAGSTEVVVLDVENDVNIGPCTILPMWRDEHGELWVAVEDAQQDADLTDCVGAPDEKAVIAGPLMQVVAIRTGFYGEDLQQVEKGTRGDG